MLRLVAATTTKAMPSVPLPTTAPATAKTRTRARTTPAIILLLCCIVFNCLHYAVAVAAAASNNNAENVDVDVPPGEEGVLRRIDITRKPSIHLNGIEIHEHTLWQHLENHERALLFGKAKAPEARRLKLVHLSAQRTPATKDTTTATTTTTKTAATADNNAGGGSVGGAAAVERNDTLQRHRRDAEAATHQQSGNNQKPTTTTNGETASQQQQGAAAEVAVQIQDNEELLKLQLRQAPKLIDEAFIVIRRYANSTQFMENSHKLAEKYERCFYSNAEAALDLCDERHVRGVFRHNDADYVIHPLPERFGNATHVIIEQQKRTTTTTLPPGMLDVGLAADMNLRFEPNEEAFNELNATKFASNMQEIIAGELESVTRATRNTKTSMLEREDRHNYHHKHQKLNYELPLHLRYKPSARHQHGLPRKQQHSGDQISAKHKHKQHAKGHSHHHHHHHHHQTHQPQNQLNRRHRRHISASNSRDDWQPPPSPNSQVLHIETAIFVDSDLYRHIAKFFPEETEMHLMRFVLTMVNGVQLLYQHPSLGHRVNFVLKRLDILHTDPVDLRRSEDLDTYLSNFCMWQNSWNPPSDKDPVHYDHAVMLTGLDLYYLHENGKNDKAAVGLAPVRGMCTTHSSCSINEGKHFESVFVVAHEIGHNLGMRHDNNKNNCDPSQHIMSPTLGSGKTTWSKCSRNYLNEFLADDQASCLFDRGQFIDNLDHSAEGLLPGERFDANQQCMLKYGRESIRSGMQTLTEICRDLHCQKDRFTWHSHPALEGTKCGDNMWCRSGYCVARPHHSETYSVPKQALTGGKPGYDKSSFVEASKMGHLLHEHNYNKPSTWGDWGEASPCDSGCLYGPSNRLREGSTGLRTFSRSCLDHRRRCLGRDRKFESCIAKQCYSIPIVTIGDFAMQVCEKAAKFDAELTGEGNQIPGGIEESCKIYCKTKTNGTKSRNWTFPDGTTCRSAHYNYDDIAYCIAGRCEKFSCDNSTKNYYKIDSVFCSYRQPPRPPEAVELESRRVNSYKQRYAADIRGESVTTSNRIYGPTTVRSKYENEVVVRPYHNPQQSAAGQQQQQQSSLSAAYKRKMDPYQSYPYQKYNNYRVNNSPPPPVAPPTHAPPVAASLVALSTLDSANDWVVKSGCHSSCMAKSKGIQVVTSRRTGANNIQLCTHAVKPCEHLLTPTEYAESTCARYKLKVRGLSGHGTQITASINEPDRSCRVGCQDEFLKYRYYLVNGKSGYFPLGTRCSEAEERYCVNGKCLKFGLDNIPLEQSHISLALFRNRRSAEDSAVTEAAEERAREHQRHKRSFLYYEPVNITETVTQDLINSIVSSIINFEQRQLHQGDADLLSVDHIEFTNPIHVTVSDVMHLH